MGGNVRKMRGLLSSTQPICAGQVHRTRVGCEEVRGASSLSASQGGDGARRGECSAALFRKVIGRKGRGRLAACHAATATSSADDCWGWTGARPVGAAGWRPEIGQRRVCRLRTG